MLADSKGFTPLSLLLAILIPVSLPLVGLYEEPERRSPTCHELLLQNGIKITFPVSGFMGRYRVSVSHDAGRKAHEAKRQAEPWVIALARFGYAAKGIVYGVIGILAFQAAFGAGGQTTDTRGALQEIVRQPFGQILLGIIGVGLIGYALWRFVQAGLDPEGKGTDAKGIVKRIGYAGSGFAYMGLALAAFQILTGSGSGGGGEQSQQHWTARLLAQPFGQWLVGIVALIILGVALNAFYVAYSAKFRDKLKIGEMSSAEETWVTRLGRAGLAARGVVFLLVGWFFIQAALQSDASETGGLDKALETLASQPYGPWLLGLVALGVIAYGLYALAEARYRRIYM
jgi:hypothetical protein